MKKPIPWDRILLWIAYALLCGIIVHSLLGCERRTYTPPIHFVAPAPDPVEETLSQKVHRLEGELSAAKADLRFTQDHWLRVVATWSACLCALGAIACSVGSFFLPVMKKRLLIGAVAFAAGIAVALTIRQFIPALPWLGLGIMAVGVCATLPTFVKHAHLSKGG